MCTHMLQGEVRRVTVAIRVRRALVRDTAQRCYGRARIAVKTRELERATTLRGAAAAIVEQQGTAWPPDETPHFERSRAAVADALNRQPLERVVAGQEMSSAQAVQDAVGKHASRAGPE
jgi:hypothetical protein